MNPRANSTKDFLHRGTSLPVPTCLTGRRNDEGRGRRVQRKGKKKQTTLLMYEVMDEANSRATQIIGYHSDDDVFASADSFLLSSSSSSSSSFDPYHIPFRLLLRFEKSATASVPANSIGQQTFEDRSKRFPRTGRPPIRVIRYASHGTRSR